MLKNKKTYYYGWRIVFVGLIGMMFSVNTFKIFSFGIFVNPLHESFGWSRGDIFYTVSLISFTTVFTSLLSGVLIEKIGARKLIFWSTFLLGFNIMGLCFLNANIWLFYAIFLLMTLIGCGTLPGVYSKEILVWFEKKKGAALGLVSAGIGLGAVVFPIMITYVIETTGWREAYWLIGVLVLMTSFILKTNFKYNPKYFNVGKDGEPLSANNNVADNNKTHAMDVWSFSKIMISKEFILLGVIFFLIGLANTGIIVNEFPFLESKGFSTQQVAFISATFGLALVCGKFLCGYLLDKINAEKLMLGFYLLGAIFLYPFIKFTHVGLLFISIFIIGLSLGATIPGIMYLLSKYFGFKHFAKSQGLVFSIFQIGGIFGPLLIGWEENKFQDTTRTMYGFIVVYVVACILLLYLGRYKKREHTKYSL